MAKTEITQEKNSEGLEKKHENDNFDTINKIEKRRRDVEQIIKKWISKGRRFKGYHERHREFTRLMSLSDEAFGETMRAVNLIPDYLVSKKEKAKVAEMQQQEKIDPMIYRKDPIFKRDSSIHPYQISDQRI